MDTLTNRQQAAIAALLTEPTLSQAAHRARVGEATLRRWLKLPTFVTAYRAARRKAMDQVIGGLQQAAGRTVESLERNLSCGRPGDQIRAAVAILGFAARGLEQSDLMERVDELEHLLNDSEINPGLKATRPAAGEGPANPP